MNQVFTLPPRPTVPVAGAAATLPVRRVYCVGRNYADHAREMGHDPNREPPFFFQKNAENLVTNGLFPYAPRTQALHHEVELVVALRSGGSDIDPASALSHVYGYAVGLDMTRRDLQNEAKKLGRPWELAKAFEHSAPVSAIVPAERSGHPRAGAIWLEVNGERRQTGDLSAMIWDVPHVISFLSTLFELGAGDLIFTGTPAGVGPVARGDRLHGHVEGVGDLEVRVV